MQLRTTSVTNATAKPSLSPVPPPPLQSSSPPASPVFTPIPLCDKIDSTSKPFTEQPLPSSTHPLIPPPVVPILYPPVAQSVDVSTPQQAVEALLGQNLDVVSLPAVTTLLKYVQNILAHPLEGKYREINTANKAFQAKISAAQGGLSVLFAAGFSFSATAADADSGRIAPTTATDSTSLLVYKHAVSEGESAEVITEQLEQLFLSQDVLLAALSELLGESQDRLPAQLSRAEVTQQLRESSSLAAVATAAVTGFDPFTATVVRTNPQPVRVAGDSQVDRQLSELQRRRSLLEGSPDSVQRLTAVFFPAAAASSGVGAGGTLLEESVVGKEESSDSHTSGTSYASNTSNSFSGGGGGTGSSKGGLTQLLQGVVGRQQAADEAPLTTRAVRDLQRLQRERVYSKTLVSQLLLLQ